MTTKHYIVGSPNTATYYNSSVSRKLYDSYNSALEEAIRKLYANKSEVVIYESIKIVKPESPPYIVEDIK